MAQAMGAVGLPSGAGALAEAVGRALGASVALAPLDAALTA
tara:strand:+ start:682 stop:804 length:123 start_codon:yes stop_codon:yes gene_type:complete